MSLRLLCALCVFASLRFQSHAQTPAPKLPQLNDPSLRLEKLVTFPEVEACTTVCGDPSGAFYVGNDPRDSRLNTAQPKCTIVRFSSMGADRKRTVFAGQLYSPAGMAWHDGWLYVIHDPLLTRFKDTDGDGLADVREDLVTNLGLPPYEGLNDHVVSGFTLGMDGFFYISVGDRGIYQARGKDGRELSMRGGGIIRVRPDGTGLEIFSAGTRNHLAVALDAEDNAFTLDNTDDGNGWWTRLTHHIEGGYYGYPYDYQHAPNYGVMQPSPQTLDAIRRSPGVSPVGPAGVPPADPAPQQAGSPLAPQAGSLCSAFLSAITDFGPGSPTGGLCYLSDGLPEQYRGRLIFSEWGKGNIAAIEVARAGATFRFVKNTPLIQSAPGADFRPMQVSVAADGSLLIADWGWGGWKAPKPLGTIWRLSWPEAHPAPRLPDESKASAEELIAALGHPDRDQRLRAEYALVKKGEGIVEKLSALVKDENVPTVHRVHALWALNQIARKSEDAWEEKHGSAKLTKLADRVESLLGDLMNSSNETMALQSMRAFTPYRMGRIPGQIIDTMMALSRNGSPALRMQAVITDGAMVGYQPHQLIAALDDDDAWVRFAAMVALQRSLRTGWMGAVGSNTPTFFDEIDMAISSDNQRIRNGIWLMLERAVEAHAMAVRTTYWFEGKSYPTDDHFGSVSWALARAMKSLDAETRARVAKGFGRIAYQPKPYDGHWWGTQPVKNPPPPHSVAWAGTPRALAALTAALADADPGVRLAAAQAFTGFTLDAAGKPAGAALRARLSTETEATVRRQLIEALGVQRDPEAMGVFTAIALDEKAAAEFRDTAISAVVSIGGDAAKQTIAQLAGAQVSPAATRKIIEAAGELRVLEAAPALIAHLADENAGNRQAAVKALAQLGPKANATPPLIAALADQDDKVKQAALEALGALRDKAALPALLEFAKTKKNAKELVAALAAMPDPQSIPVLVNALRDNNSGLRRNALKALKTMRAAALPPIEELLASGKIPKEFEPEIRAAFDSGAIAKWKMIGPFENVWGAVHPPERSTGVPPVGPAGVSPAEAAGQQAGSPLARQAGSLSYGPDLAKKYVNAEGHEVGWRDVTADNDAGHVNLEKIFATNGMVCAYAFAEIEAPAEAEAHLLCGSDDQIAVWLNGAKVHDSGPGSRGYEEDKDDVPLHFAAGKNALLVKIGNVGGGWEFNARIPGLDGGKFVKPKDAPPDAKQRAFVLAQNTDGTWTHRGDAKRGEKIFHDPTGPLGGICAQCHKVRGLGPEVGPDLSLVGSVYKRGDLLISIMEPSKTIALGYEQFMVETKGGDTFAGAIRKDAADTLTLLGADQQPHVVKKADIKTQTPVPASIMPPALTLGLKPEDLADLLAYLESLRGN